MSGRTRLYLWVASVNSLYSVFIITVIVHFYIIVYFMASAFFLYRSIYFLLIKIIPYSVFFYMRINADEPPIRTIVKRSEINQFHSVAEYPIQ